MVNTVPVQKLPHLLLFSDFVQQKYNDVCSFRARFLVSEYTEKVCSRVATVAGRTTCPICWKT